MWGSETWGEMIWSGSVTAVPMLDPAALVFLVCLMIGSVLLTRRAEAPQWIGRLGAFVVILAPLASFSTSLVLTATAR